MTNILSVFARFFFFFTVLTNKIVRSVQVVGSTFMSPA